MSSSVPTTSPLCLRCLSLLDEGDDGFNCRECGAYFKQGPIDGTISTTAEVANFAHEIDSLIFDELIPWLNSGIDERDAELALPEFGARRGLSIGNPFWEGRADFIRLQPNSRGVVLDVGCGMGTIATAVARTAEHVFALDRSEARVALTSTRARAAGLANVTGVHGVGLNLPFGDGTMDMVSIVGVLEWTGVGEANPFLAQQRVLREAARVLKPPGTLVIGIENRFGAHYFAGAREEHVELPFVSLLPRPLARAYCRLAGRGRFETPTHSERALRKLLQQVGLSARFAYPLPSYSDPQFAFGEGQVAEGRDLYLHHFFHFHNGARRLAGRALALAQPKLIRLVAPSFWVVAERAPTDASLPIAATGTATVDGTVKLFDPEGAAVSRIARRRMELVDESPLIDGWNARRWVAWPLRRSGRVARALVVLRELEQFFEERDGRPWGPAGETAIGEAERTLEALRGSLSPDAHAWAEQAVTAVRITEPSVEVEHGDLRLTNILIDRNSRMVVIDRADNADVGLVGRDAVTAVLDVFAVLEGTKEFDPLAGIDGLLRASSRLRAAARATLLASVGHSSHSRLCEVIAVALLCDVAQHHGSLARCGGAIEKLSVGAGSGIFSDFPGDE